MTSSSPAAFTPALGIDIGGTSVKASLLRSQASSSECLAVHDGTPEGLRRAMVTIVESLDPHIAGVAAVGVCLPGLYDASADCLVRAVNLPGLVGVALKPLVSSALPRPSPLCVRSDALAAGIDDAAERHLSGRLLAVSLGTGVGAIVLDGDAPLRVSPPDAPLSSGHLGQMDVSLTADAPVGPDGGRGSLEAYIGAPALRARLGDLPAALPRLAADDPAVRALVRALRVAHAIYRPDHVSLLGGVGLGLAHLVPAIHAAVTDGLTSIARPHWTLVPARHTFHAARGAARLALRDQAQPGA